MKKKANFLRALVCIAIFLTLEAAAVASGGNTRGANDPTVMPIGRRPHTPFWARP